MAFLALYLSWHYITTKPIHFTYHKNQIDFANEGFSNTLVIKGKTRVCLFSFQIIGKIVVCVLEHWLCCRHRWVWIIVWISWWLMRVIWLRRVTCLPLRRRWIETWLGLLAIISLLLLLLIYKEAWKSKYFVPTLLNMLLTSIHFLEQTQFFTNN